MVYLISIRHLCPYLSSHQPGDNNWTVEHTLDVACVGAEIKVAILVQYVLLEWSEVTYLFSNLTTKARFASGVHSLQSSNTPSSPVNLVSHDHPTSFFPCVAQLTLYEIRGQRVRIFKTVKPSA